MTNVSENATADGTSSPGIDTDLLDTLVPAPRPAWQRFAIGLVLVASVGWIAWLWYVGDFYPQPDCCGSGGGDPTLALAPDGTGVTATLMIYNSSPRPIDIVNVAADLDGATVLDLGAVDGFPSRIPTLDIGHLPFRVPARSGAWVAITFVPDRCDDAPSDRWHVVAELASTSWLPNRHRNYTLTGLPDQPGITFGLFGPDGFDPAADPALAEHPLDAACRMLAAAGTRG
jgi:hypothetical protein